MNYQSPIEIIQTQLQSQIEGEIYKAVMNVGVNVDKEELIKALSYDRNQYQKGYADRDLEIVRCNDCIHYRYYGMTDYPVSECTIDHCENPDADWFCADGKRRTDDA